MGVTADGIVIFRSAIAARFGPRFMVPFEIFDDNAELAFGTC